MSKGRFTWAAHDDESCLTVRFAEQSTSEGIKSVVLFQWDGRSLTFTREEWEELCAVVEECFTANEEEE